MDFGSLPVFRPNANNEFQGLYKNVPFWSKWNVAVNGANLDITAPDGTVTSVALAAALTQDVTLAALPPRAHLLSAVIKAAVAATGTTTLTGGLGITGTDNYYLAKTFDLKAAVSDTNYNGGTNGVMAKTGLGGSFAALNLLFALVATVDNLTALLTGSFDIWVLISFLP
jgi:hypothetical protein